MKKLSVILYSFISRDCWQEFRKWRIFHGLFHFMPLCSCNCLNFSTMKRYLIFQLYMCNLHTGIYYFTFDLQTGVFQSNEDLEVFMVPPKSHPMEPNGRRRRSRLASNKFKYFEKCVVHIWAPFFCGPVSPCIHVPVVGHSSTVTSSLWLGEYWSNGDLQAS